MLSPGEVTFYSPIREVNERDTGDDTREEGLEEAKAMESTSVIGM